jgi:integrase
MMTMAIEDGIITANPAAGLQKYVGGRETTATPDPYSPDELQLYLQTCINRFPSYYPFFLSLACTGMRLGEAIALNWGDIDFHSRFIVVSKTITEGIEGTPKTGASRRVPMTIELAETLKRLRTTRKKQTISNGWQIVPDRIFITDTATTYHPANLTRRVHNKITEYAGLRRIRLHDFRHTYATIRLNKGDAIQKVSKALGHKNVHITIGTYMHYITEHDQDDVDALDSLFVPTAQTKKNAKEAY